MKRIGLKNEKGITLVALVVTIIVLIILAGVSINLVLGERGLLTRARDGRNNYQLAANEEAVILAGGESTIDSWINGNGGGSGEEDGNISIELSIAGTKVNATTPPNPDSNIFEHMEGTIDTGYVIKDKNNGNEFVWVPVEKDQKITLKVISKENIKEIKIYDPYGEEIDLSINDDLGIIYTNSNITPTINGFYTAEIKTDNTTEIKTLNVKSLYAQDSFSDFDISDITDEYAVSKGYSNVSELLDDYGCSLLEYYYFGDGRDWIANCLDTVDYSESVNNNGGFYIARYEAGATNQRTLGDANDTVSSIIASNGIPVSKANQIPYNYITAEQAQGLTQSMYPSSTNYTCDLITGSGWDRTLRWLIETGSKNFDEITKNSSGWGNFPTSKFNVTIGKYAEKGLYTIYPFKDVEGTYSTQSDKIVFFSTAAAPNRNVSNNIFDLAGNMTEWTNEAR